MTPTEARLRPIMFVLMLGPARGRKVYRGMTEGLMEANAPLTWEIFVFL